MKNESMFHDEFPLDTDPFNSSNLPVVAEGTEISIETTGDEDSDYWDTYELINALIDINEPVAADFLIEVAEYSIDLSTFVDSDSLLEVFMWHYTPQGFGFWEKIYHELVHTAYEEYPEGFDNK